MSGGPFSYTVNGTSVTISWTGATPPISLEYNPSPGLPPYINPTVSQTSVGSYTATGLIPNTLYSFNIYQPIHSYTLFPTTGSGLAFGINWFYSP